jgi:hypothetical protein
MRKGLVNFSIFMTAFCLSCSGDGGGGTTGTPMPTDQEESVQRVVEGPNQLAALAANPADDQAIQGLFDLNADLNNVVSYGMQQKYETRSSPLVETLRQPIDPSCYKVEENKVTYDHCVESGLTIDGWIQNADNVVSCDMTIKGTFEGTGIDMSYKGSVTVTDQFIDGQLDIVMKVVSSGMTVDYTLQADYQHIVLTDGCPTGGTLAVSATYSTMGTNYHIMVEIVFGPACGDAAATTY